MEASLGGGGEQGFASRPSGAVGWAAAIAFVWAVQSLKNLSLAEQLVVEAGLYKDIAFLKYKKAIGKLTFLFYQFSSFYISPPHARPPKQVLSDFRVGQWI